MEPIKPWLIGLWSLFAYLFVYAAVDFLMVAAQLSLTKGFFHVTIGQVLQAGKTPLFLIKVFAGVGTAAIFATVTFFQQRTRYIKWAMARVLSNMNGSSQSYTAFSQAPSPFYLHKGVKKS